MKRKAIISALGLVFCGYMAAQAQESVVQPAANQQEAKNVSGKIDNVSVDYDIKLYASKEEALSAARNRNPEKPTTPDFDIKQEADRMSVKDLVPNPSRLTTPDTDPKLNAGEELNSGSEKAPEVSLSQQGNSSSDIDANTGLEKVKAEGVIFNYRDINGPPSQKIPAPQGKIINYRDLKGPDDQPREKQPAR